MTAPLPIVVAYASIGSGPRLAADAVARELTTLADEGVAVETIDALEGAQGTRRGGFMTSLLARTGRGSAASDRSGQLALALGSGYLAWELATFERKLLTARPALVVCTHPWAAVIATRLVNAGKLRTRVVGVCTEFGVHGLWPRAGLDVLCVANQDSADDIVDRALPFDAVATGIPVRRQFGIEYDCNAAREHFGLPLDKRLLLAIAGASTPGPYADFRPAFEVALPALASLPNTAVAVVTGSDGDFADAMAKRAHGFGTRNVIVLGGVDHMAPLMACADLGIAKPGGLVCAEAMSAALPLVLVGPSKGPDLANADALVAAGAAVYTGNPQLLAETARKVAAKPAKLARLREATATLARPFAATEVARRALELVGLLQPEPEPRAAAPASTIVVPEVASADARE
jgi:processive 1,2-diacylglycerol beta-glucosyltransferase